jgi:hypothetical protein
MTMGTQPARSTESPAGPLTIGESTAASRDTDSSNDKTDPQPDPRAIELRRPIPAGPGAEPQTPETNLDGRELLRLVGVALERRGLPVQATPSGGIASRCPSIHRSGPRAFEAWLDEDGSLSLTCHLCGRTTGELLALLGLAGPGCPHDEADGLHHGRIADGCEFGSTPAGDSTSDRAWADDDRDDQPDESADQGDPREDFEPGTVHYLLWRDEETLDEPGERDSVRRLIDRYPIRAVGRRPEDHRVRDLMHGSCFRIPRLQRFGRLARDPEDWQVAGTAGLPEGVRRQAATHLALRRDHLGGLYRLSRDLPPGLEGWKPIAYIRRLMECPPHGVLLDRDDAQLNRLICKRKRLCPWCLARWSDDYFRRLIGGPCRPEAGSGKIWVMGRITVEARDDGRGPTRDRVERTRRRWSGALTRWARDRLGSVGGVWIHQIGPPRGPGLRFACRDGHVSAEAALPGHDYEHDLTILCEVPNRTAEDRERFRRGIGIGRDHWEVEPPSAPDDDGEEDFRPIRVAAVTAEGRNGLRYLWFGTSNDPVGSRPEIFRNDELEAESRRLGHRGLDGAVRMQPWWLFGADEWLAYAAATKRLHLVEPFGAWIDQLPAKPPGSTAAAEGDRLFGGEARRSRARRRARAAGRRKMAAPHVERNRRTAQAARGEREAKLELARPVFRRLAIEAGGRPPGRDRLRRAMMLEGHPIGPAVAEDITRMLKAEAGGGGPARGARPADAAPGGPGVREGGATDGGGKSCVGATAAHGEAYNL